MAKSYNPRRSKIHRSYTVAEAAELFGVTRRAVWAWIKNGLPMVRTSGPILIIGSDLQEFLTKRQAARLRPCPPGSIYCLKCREPRKPSLGSIIVAERSASSGNVQGCCPECGSGLNRRVALSKLEEAGFGGASREAGTAQPS